jgi:hypothetical protein
VIVAQTRRQDLEHQEEITDSEPGENHVDRVEDELEEEEELAHDGVIGPEELVEVDDGVDGGEEGTVEPTAPLQNQLRHRVRHICLARRRLDVLKNPVAVALGDELEAENTILGQVHVGCEDTSVTTVELLASEVLLQGTLPALVVLKGNVPIGGKRTG